MITENKTEKTSLENSLQIDGFLQSFHNNLEKIIIFVCAALFSTIIPILSPLFVKEIGSFANVFTAISIVCVFSVLLGIIVAALTSNLNVVQRFVLMTLLVIGGSLIYPNKLITIPDYDYTNRLMPFFMQSILGYVGFHLFAVGFVLLNVFNRHLNKNKDEDAFNKAFLTFLCGALSGLVFYFLLVEPIFLSNVRVGFWGFLYHLQTSLILFYVYSNTKKLGLSKNVIKKEIKTSPEKPLFEKKICIKTFVKKHIFTFMLAFIISGLTISTTLVISDKTATDPTIFTFLVILVLIAAKIGFSKFSDGAKKVSIPFQVYILIAYILYILLLKNTTFISITIHVLMLFVAQINLFSELKKQPKEETFLFFLLLSFGALLGLVFVYSVAPSLFVSFAEYPLFLAMSLGLVSLNDLPKNKNELIEETIYPLTIGIIIIGFFYFARRIGGVDLNLLRVIICLFAGMSIFAIKRPLKLSLSYGMIMFCTYILFGHGSFGNLNSENKLLAKRNFYGSYKITTSKSLLGFKKTNSLVVGEQIRGAQIYDEELEKFATAQHAINTPFGKLFETFHNVSETWNVAVIGAGTGAVSCYARLGQTWTFFDVNKEFVNDVTKGKHFTHLSKCKPDAKVVIGNPVKLINNNEENFDLIIVDTMATPNPLPYLMTYEAIKTFANKLTPTGMLLFNVESKALNYESLLAQQAKMTQMASYHSLWSSPQIRTELFQGVREWTVMTKSNSNLSLLRTNLPNWYTPTESIGVGAWYDDHITTFGLFRSPFNVFTSLVFEKPLYNLIVLRNKITMSIETALNIFSSLFKSQQN